MDTLYYLFVVLAFLAVVMFLEGLYLVWNAYRGPEASRIERRLLAMSAATDSVPEIKLIRKRLLSEVPAIERLLLQLPRIHGLDRFLLQSGLNITVAVFLGVCVTLAVLATAAGMAAGLQGWLTAIIAVVLVALWSVYVQRRRLLRMRAIEDQLPDALELMARAMQAGHAFSSALRMVGMEGPRPIAAEFQIAFDEINFGIPTQQALSSLSQRVLSTDLRYFVIAVLIQRETGGNLAELLTTIAYLIRERQKLVGTVRVLSTEGRLSAWILGILPFALVAGISLLNPRFIRVLWTDPAGINLAIASLVLMALGVIWLWRVVQVRI